MERLEPATSPGRVFGNVVDTLIRQAPCDLVLVKLGHREEQQDDGTTVPLVHCLAWNRWLVPIAGVPIPVMPCNFYQLLAKLDDTDAKVTQVFPPSIAFTGQLG
jgi:CIC family chloride channel protein